jgi:AcrR family transcriptional regulator
MQDIADASEISKGSLYLQFANKEALIGALLGRTFDRLEAIIEREIASPGKARDRLNRIVKANIESAKSEDGFDQNLWLLSRLSPQPDSPQQILVRGRIERLADLVTVIFEEGARDGTVRADIDPKNLVRLFSLISTLFMERISKIRLAVPSVDTTEEKLFKEFLDILLYYISPTAGRTL